MKEFIVLYEWHTGEQSVHEFDTIEEAMKDREQYIDAGNSPIYQLVKEERICYLPGGELARRPINE